VLCAFALGAQLLVACGGRYVREPEGDALSAGGSSSGASNLDRGGSAPSLAGASNAGASSGGASSGGASDAGSSSGGSSSGGASAGSSSGGASDAGSSSGGSSDAGSSDAGECNTIECDQSCRAGLEAYAAERQAILDRYGRYKCDRDRDCLAIAPLNSCEQGCSFESLRSGLLVTFDTQLENLANKYCSSCRLAPLPPCVPPDKVKCRGGRCTWATY